MSGNRTVKVVISGDASGGQKALQQLDASGDKSASAAEAASAKISSVFSKMGSAIGGEMGELGSTLGEVFGAIGEDGDKMGAKIAAAGAAITGAGVLLTAMGSKDKQAQDQLAQAIANTGQSADDYSDQIEKMIGHEENFGHSSADTQSALEKMTTALGDPNKALANMAVVTDLAAQKHESLSAAADQVDKILAGSGAKTLAQYGITMGTTGDKTANAQVALLELSDKLSGQATASMDNWSGRLDVAKVKLEDWGAKFGEVAGPAVTALGPTLMLGGAAMDLYAAHTAKTAAAQAALADALKTEGASADGAVAPNLAAASAEDSLSAAADEAGVSMLGALGPVGLVLAGMVALGAAVDPLVNKLGNDLDPAWAQTASTLKSAKAAMGDFQQQLTDTGGVLDAQGRKTELATLQAAGLGDSYAKTGTTLAGFGELIEGSDADFNRQINTMKDSNEITLAQFAVLTELKSEFDAGTISGQKLAAAEAALAASTDKASAAVIPMLTQLAAEDQRMASLSDNTLSAAKASDSFKDSLQSAADSVKTNGKSLDDNTVAGRANEEAVMDAISAAKAHADAVYKQTGNITDATAALNQDQAQLLASTTAAGLNSTAVKGMITQYGGVPSDIATDISLNTQNALANLANYQAAFAVAEASWAKVATVLGGPTFIDSHGVAAYAAGGIVGAAASGGNRSGRVKVGEVGWEYADLPKGTEVYTHGQSMAMDSAAGGSGSDTINVNVTVNGNVTSDNQLVDFIMDAIAKRQRASHGYAGVTIRGGR